MFAQRFNNDEPVTSVKELGFDNAIGLVDGKQIATEELFFIDHFGRDSFAVTEEAVREAIAAWKHDIETLELYLQHGMSNNTHAWPVKKGG